MPLMEECIQPGLYLVVIDNVSSHWAWQGLKVKVLWGFACKHFNDFTKLALIAQLTNVVNGTVSLGLSLLSLFSMELIVEILQSCLDVVPCNCCVVQVLEVGRWQQLMCWWCGSCIGKSVLVVCLPLLEQTREHCLMC